MCSTSIPIHSRPYKRATRYPNIMNLANDPSSRTGLVSNGDSPPHTTPPIRKAHTSSSFENAAVKCRIDTTVRRLHGDNKSNRSNSLTPIYIIYTYSTYTIRRYTPFSSIHSQQKYTISILSHNRAVCRRRQIKALSFTSIFAPRSIFTL